LQVVVEAPRRLVGHTDVAHLAGADEIAQHLQRVLERSEVRLVGVLVAQMAKEVGGTAGPVHLIEVHVVGLQPLEAAVDRLHEVPAVESVVAATDVVQPQNVARARYLGGQDDAVAAAPLPDPTADDPLGGAIGFGPRRHGVHF
jgi:hypothetical protein